MKGKTGVDRTTQIEENDPELFDFNYEVQPIVDVSLVLFTGVAQQSHRDKPNGALLGVKSEREREGKG